jgi:hypothetical protein
MTIDAASTELATEAADRLGRIKAKGGSEFI